MPNSQKYYIDNNINKYLSDIKPLSILITHEFEQLRHIDNDADYIRNSKFTKKYYDSLEVLYKKVIKNNLKLEDVTDDIKKDIFKILYNKSPKNFSYSILNKENNIPLLESKYLNSKPEILVIEIF
mgnify:FL=1